jgi:hypothetical protein
VSELSVFWNTIISYVDLESIEIAGEGGNNNNNNNNNCNVNKKIKELK